MCKYFLFFTLFVGSLFAESCDLSKLKILHLSFHRGCVGEIQGIGKALSLDITSCSLIDKPREWLDGKSSGNAMYNIGHERANAIWNKHREFFDSFDVIITSDTAPLSRVFLQNGWEKPLIIWICNRFDYSDVASLDCDFPDKAYYDLFRAATKAPNVIMIGYTAYEHVYAKQKGIDTGGETITPCGASQLLKKPFELSPSPSKKETFFLPPYHNEQIFMNLSRKCQELGIPNHCARYSDFRCLVGFKGVIHLPYAWSNFLFFENIALGLPYFVPSKEFQKELSLQGDYFQSYTPKGGDLFSQYAEWYSPEHASVITYFDSWEDLKMKIDGVDFSALSAATKSYAEEYQKVMLGKWKIVFDKCCHMLQ